MAGLNTGGNIDIESGVEGMHVRGKTSRDVFHCYHAIDVFVLVMLQAAERQRFWDIVSNISESVSQYSSVALNLLIWGSGYKME